MKRGDNVFEQERMSIVEYGKKLLQSNHVTGSAGNLSLRVSDNLIAISPSGIPYAEMTQDQVPIMNLDGKVIWGNFKPSVEYRLHLEVYKNFEDVKAIIHTHSIYASVLSVLRMPLMAVTETVLMISEQIPVSEYANAGTIELARNVVEAMKKSRAVIMANHGLICAASSLKEALNMCENVERNAQIYVLALMTNLPVHIIDSSHAKEAMEFLRKNYGQRG